MKLDVCICTHNPRPEIFQVILTAIAHQTLSKDAYQVWVVDNASEPPINDDDLAPLAQAGVTYHLLREERLGTMYARELVSQAVPGESLILVDDDNELLPDYLKVAVEILDKHPEIGYFGGKLLSGIKVDYPEWMNELLPYLGIKDEGDEAISKCIEGDYYWGKWEPPCAGAVIRKVVLNKYFQELQQLPPNLVLGRQGKKGLLSMADSWLAHCTYQLGLQCSYQPRLQLIHHIDPNRLNSEYLLRLIYNYGRSDVIFKKLLDRPLDRDLIKSINDKISWWKNGSVSTAYFLCLLAEEWGYNRELDPENQIDFITSLDRCLRDTLGEQQQVESLQQQVESLQQQVESLQQQVESLQQQVESLQQQIKGMENSKLWKLRKQWFKIKKQSIFTTNE